jgi:hypothetical protein
LVLALDAVVGGGVAVVSGRQVDPIAARDRLIAVPRDNSILSMSALRILRKSESKSSFNADHPMQLHLEFERGSSIRAAPVEGVG